MTTSEAAWLAFNKIEPSSLGGLELRCFRKHCRPAGPGETRFPLEHDSEKPGWRTTKPLARVKSIRAEHSMRYTI